MKILGIGVDIESVERFHGLTIKSDSQFLNKIYTKNELKYCFSHKKHAQHLAVRFAGKEAVIKAMNGVSGKIFSVKDINIINTDNGSPVVKISKIYGNARVLISLSHCHDKAIAFVVVVRD
ncbi:MAG: 4'-phosphopantetheinyl transferase [Candidatus Magasanikbacteria bacterium GW2011_GWC2_45_8]|uniref:Holo-[acyl-carrier-protein] synthase n=1 Tax=Candidatus Magasanikbacteria bacterium GW2011_GWC2_45_8 TaxID=1619050 RepID=A0A0G1N0J3_9BACT|nr:MAG: 4'-phosphopantetheinyl transferase [Candidatus Magasanikbacteria bacterium GW2011_GWC2_45_8]